MTFHICTHIYKTAIYTIECLNARQFDQTKTAGPTLDRRRPNRLSRYRLLLRRPTCAYIHRHAQIQRPRSRSHNRCPLAPTPLYVLTKVMTELRMPKACSLKSVTWTAMGRATLATPSVTLNPNSRLSKIVLWRFWNTKDGGFVAAVGGGLREGGGGRRKGRRAWRWLPWWQDKDKERCLNTDFFLLLSISTCIALKHLQ